MIRDNARHANRQLPAKYRVSERHPKTMAWFDFVLGYLGNLITIIIDVTFDGVAKNAGRQTMAIWAVHLRLYGGEREF